jgi:nucleoside-diphosphate-sugar epimerase
MRIAVLGATSQIARDLIKSFSAQSDHEWVLYARRPEAVKQWLDRLELTQRHKVAEFDSFSVDYPFNAILNFVGVGNPAQAMAIGASIFDITAHYDDIALRYLRLRPECRYIFFSSGAVYGGGFALPADDQTTSSFSVNHLGPQDWYGLAKLYAEARHRAMPELSIVDLRIFNYFSESTDIDAGFLITDVLRSIRDGQVLQTSQENIVRDYIGPKECWQLVLKVLKAPPQNVAIDYFTQAPVDKISMLERMRTDFGLRYTLIEQRTGLLATGSKLNYYSRSRKAADLFGYAPEMTSLDVVSEQSRRLLSRL